MRAGGAGGLERVHRADHVHLGVECRPLHRRADVGLRGEVEDDVGVRLERRADVVLQQRGGGVDVLAATRAEVVEHDHLVPARDQGVDEVGADEAGPAGDERAHRCSLESRPGRWSNVPAMFVSFEGLDGCGKTTQARLLAETLAAEGVDVVSTREPGGTPLGEQIRDLVLHGDHVAPWAEAALYVAARAQHVDQVIRPALERGATVVCDRYLDYVRRLPGRRPGARGRHDPRAEPASPSAGCVPDRTFLVEIDTATALARVGEQGATASSGPGRSSGRVSSMHTGLLRRGSPSGTSSSTGGGPIPEIARGDP